MLLTLRLQNTISLIKVSCKQGLLKNHSGGLHVGSLMPDTFYPNINFALQLTLLPWRYIHQTAHCPLAFHLA